MATVVPLGPGTVTIGATPLAFDCEVTAASVTHEYDTADSVTRLCGDVVPGESTRTDTFTASITNDLTAAGLYAYIHSVDMTVQPLIFTPNTAAAATWTGDVTVTLPDAVGADEFGAPMAGAIAWVAVDTLTFDPEYVPPVAATSATSA